MVETPSERMQPTEYLHSQQVLCPEFASYWTEFEQLHNKKLWHQLTSNVEKFLHEKNVNKVELIPFYENFIADFEDKINPLALVEIVGSIVRHMKNCQESLAFIEKTKEKVKRDRDGKLLCDILTAQIKVVNNDLDGVKSVLEQISPIINEQTGITPVHGRYFQVSSYYYQLIGNHSEYFRNALRFLGCSNIENEPVEELRSRAFALSIAALLSDSIFNFGELLEHPIINYLKGTNDWLYELLQAFNAGDLVAFEKLSPKWKAQADLAAKEIDLRKKISLLCLVEMTFNSPNGVLTFKSITEKTHLPECDVELLVMRALSLGLVKGTIDEVENEVHLDWVQPRVLNKNQINSLKSKIDNWSQDVRQMEKLMESGVAEMGC